MNQAESTQNPPNSAGSEAIGPADQGPQQRPQQQTQGEGIPQKSLADRFWVFLAIAITGGGLDLWSKWAVFKARGLPGQRDISWVWEPFFGIETAVNIGAVFGVGAGQGSLFALMSVIAAIGIVIWLFWFRAAESWWLTVALGMVGGGIIGNLYDRMGLWWKEGYPEEWQTGVRDWILWRINAQWTWPNFNIADSLLVVGACMLMYQSFFPEKFATPSRGQADDRPHLTEEENQ